MEKNEFFSQTMTMIKDIEAQMASYGIDQELTAHEATKLWSALGKLHRRMGEVKNAAQARDWGDE